MATLWEPGQNGTAIGRSRHHSLSPDVFQIVGNMLMVLQGVAPENITSAAHLLALPPRQRGIDGPTFVSQVNVLSLV
jgi:hypothetical protein